MNGENDNGYHSNGEEADEKTYENADSHIFDDLHYEDMTLQEPDFESLRLQRYSRNKEIMKNFSPFVANAMHVNVESGNITSGFSEEEAAVMIQKYVRGFLAQKRYLQLLLDQFEKNEEMRREKVMEQMEEAKLLIENHQLEVQFEDYNVVRRNRLQRLICHVITIQRSWRRFLRKRKTVQLGDNQVDNNEVTRNDCDDVQNGTTRHIVKEILGEMLDDVCEK